MDHAQAEYGGTTGRIVARHPDGTYRIFAEGISRTRKLCRANGLLVGLITRSEINT